jgi:tyrosinase
MSIVSLLCVYVLIPWMCFWPSVHPQPFGSYEYGIDRSKIVKRQSSPYVVTGIQHPNGSTPLRLEVRQLEQNPTLWTLYLLGLDMMQYTNQTEMLSWYQITGMAHFVLLRTHRLTSLGIHGRPFVPFDNVQAVPGNTGNGYCTHVSILFPPWHRPYLAFYEVSLARRASLIESC